MLHGAFNLFANAVLSFVLPLGVVVAIIALFRLPPGRTRLALLLLPFVKVVVDAGAGIPRNSFFWLRLSGARHELGAFQIGVAADHFGPFFSGRLESLYHGHWYSLSAADLLDTALVLKISPHAPAIAVALVVLFAAMLVGRRVVDAWRFSKESLRLRSDATLLETRRVGRRFVPIWVSPSHLGPPFAAGLLHPYVVLSSATAKRLTDEERCAVVEHELGHIAHFDVVTVFAVVSMSDLFWFLPACRWLARRVRFELELRADEHAVRAGVDPTALASSLVTVASTLHGLPLASLNAGRNRSSLVARATRLLEARGAPVRPSPAWRVAKAVTVVVVATSLLRGVFLGNHAVLAAHTPVSRPSMSGPHPDAASAPPPRKTQSDPGAGHTRN
jgi:beta-lactamase regulating signal transducer with metallopeptidase domain